jgi:regulator of PEP synthase PpsR (kinase-PPPase family)
MGDTKKIVIISGGTGETALRLMHAILAHYPEADIDYALEKTHRYVRSTEQLEKILSEIPDDRLVLFSIITEELRNHLQDALKSRTLRYLNILEPMRQTMQDFLQFNPNYESGILQKKYGRYKKMDAITFTVRHDDGMGTRIEEAELVLVGPSRTCKTPISMYVATNYGLKVANIPVVPDMAMVSQLLKRLLDVSPRIIFGTVMKPEVLASIRGTRTRLISGHSVVDDSLVAYQELEAIEKELLFCRRLYSAQNWEIIDVTERAIEEISSTLISELVISMERALEDDVGQ